MSVLWITVLLSALLAFVFLALYVRDQARADARSRTGPEHAALLPLQEPVETRAAGCAAMNDMPGGGARAAKRGA